MAAGATTRTSCIGVFSGRDSSGLLGRCHRDCVPRDGGYGTDNSGKTLPLRAEVLRLRACCNAAVVGISTRKRSASVTGGIERPERADDRAAVFHMRRPRGPARLSGVNKLHFVAESGELMSVAVATSPRLGTTAMTDVGHLTSALADRYRIERAACSELKATVAKR